MTEENVTTHGGRRKGAGRKPCQWKRKAITLRIPLWLDYWISIYAEEQQCSRQDFMQRAIIAYINEHKTMSVELDRYPNVP